VRVALRVAYDGTAFQGSQRQPHVRTVEGDLLTVLGRIGAVADAQAAAFEAAGRTDAGVSAAGNVFAFDTAFRGDELARAANAYLRDAWVLARAEVADGWSPRRAARSRTYVYAAAIDEIDADAGRAQAAFALFEGEHDFGAFARMEAGRDPRRRVDVARLSARGPMWQFTVRGDSFLWNQVRRMVAAALAVARGEAELEDVRRGLAGERVELGTAPAEGLVLQDVEYDGLRWTTEPKDARDVLAALRSRVGAARVAERRARVLLQGAEGFTRAELP